VADLDSPAAGLANAAAFGSGFAATGRCGTAEAAVWYATPTDTTSAPKYASASLVFIIVHRPNEHTAAIHVIRDIGRGNVSPV
jgi:hypothetical protein